VGSLTALRFQVKTFDCRGLDKDGTCVVTHLGASSRSFDSSQSCFSVFGDKSWFFLYILYLSLICCVRESLYHLVSIRPYVTSLIK
jgi:hypothetical protein